MRQATICWSVSVWETARGSGPANLSVSLSLVWKQCSRKLSPSWTGLIKINRFPLLSPLPLFLPLFCSGALLWQHGGDLLCRWRDMGEAVPGLDDGGLHLLRRRQWAHHLHLQKYEPPVTFHPWPQSRTHPLWPHSVWQPCRQDLFHSCCESVVTVISHTVDLVIFHLDELFSLCILLLRCLQAPAASQSCHSPERAAA